MMGMLYLAGDAVLGGWLTIALGLTSLVILGPGWAGWLRRRGRLLRQGATQQAFAGGLLGGPALILLGVILLRTSGPGRVELPPHALDTAIVSAGLVLAVAAMVIWNWKPDWLEPSWVQRERDELHRRIVEEETRRLGIDEISAASIATDLHDHLERQFGVSGFESVQTYEARTPTWTEDSFPSESEAVIAAEHWLARQSGEAQVEILHFVGNDVAEVVAVVTPDGIKRIG